MPCGFHRTPFGDSICREPWWRICQDSDSDTKIRFNFLSFYMCSACYVFLSYISVMRHSSCSLCFCFVLKNTKVPQMFCFLSSSSFKVFLITYFTWPTLFDSKVQSILYYASILWIYVRYTLRVKNRIRRIR